MQKALELYKKDKNKIGEMNTLYNFGYFYGSSENFALAKDYFVKAMPIAIELNDLERLSGIYNNIGLMYQYLGMYDKSNEYQFKALKIIEETGDNKTGYVHLNIALNYYNKSKATIIKQEQNISKH